MGGPDAAALWAGVAASFEVPPARFPRPHDLAVHLDPRIRSTPALELIDDELVALRDQRNTRLMVFMPPQEGKSQRCSRTFPLWLLEQDPTLRIVITSYEQETSVRWGREIKNDLVGHPDLGVSMRQDSQSAGRWQTRQGGGVYCVGVGGALTGQPADVLIIDDPLKDRAAAESKTQRDRVWDWWESVASLRLSRRGVSLICQTRWHNDDISGRLLEREPGRWRVLRIPAIADSPDDALGREVGREMVSATKNPGHFYLQRELRSSYVWSSVFQQRPTAVQGSVFSRTSWQSYQVVGLPDGGQRLLLDGRTHDLVDCARFVTMDLAASTRSSADFTVAAAWAITSDGDLVCLGVDRRRVSESDHFDVVRGLRQRWLHPYDVVYVESRMFGTTLVYQAGRSGIPIQELIADKDKVTRSLPAADLLRQRRVWLPSGAPWVADWVDEHADFPSGSHDDQVDVFGYAARVALTHWVPPTAMSSGTARPDVVDSGLDLTTAPW